MPPCASIDQKDGENPLMALVDAAASILDGETKKSRDGRGDVTSSNCDVTSRPSTPTVSEIPKSCGASPTSVIPEVKAMEENPYEKKLTFAEQLMTILDDENMSDILTWMPDGKSFTIKDPKRFTKEHMPRVFNIRNMSSFVRKLTRWGFSRVHEKATMNSDIFKHPDFQRGKPELCREIKCVGRSSSSTSSLTSPLKSTMPTASTSASGIMRPPALTVSMAPDGKTRASAATPPLMPQREPSAFDLNSRLESLRPSSDPFLERLALRHLLLRHQSIPPMHQISSWVPGGLWTNHVHPSMRY